MREIAVIGAGMAGLAAAYRLRQRGMRPTVFESQVFVGGRTHTARRDGFLIDTGAITLSPAYQRTLKIAEELGMRSRARIVRPVLGFADRGGMHELNLAAPISSFLATSLLTWREKLRLLKLVPATLRYRSRSHFRSMAPLAPLDGETATAWSLPKVGQSVVDKLIDPLIRLNMFTSADATPAADIVWLLNMFGNPNLIQFEGGMDSLAIGIATGLDVRLNTGVRAVKAVENGILVQWQQEGGSSNEQRFDGAVIATPPYAAVEMAPWLSGPLRDWFQRARPVHAMTVHFALRRKPAMKPAVILVPEYLSPQLLVVGLEHNKQSDRVPPGKGLIAAHMRQDWVDAQQQSSDEEAGRSALALVEPIIGPIAADIEFINIQRWPYLDYHRYVGCYRGLQKALDAPTVANIAFAGEYISAGVEGAVISGEDAAEKIASCLTP